VAKSEFFQQGSGREQHLDQRAKLYASSGLPRSVEDIQTRRTDSLPLDRPRGIPRTIRAPKCCNNVATYTFVPWKTRKFRRKCTTHMPGEVYREIAALRPLSPGRPFVAAPTLVNSARTIVWQMLQAAGEAAGVPNVHAHRTRNSFAVNALIHGALVQEVSSWLGHASVATTQRRYLPWVKGLQDASLAAYKESMERQRA